MRRRTIGFLLLASWLVACENDDHPVGYDLLGGPCRTNYDCPSGYCCTTPACGHGMCSVPCRGDVDCPGGTFCEAKTCFWGCSSDSDCAAGERCRVDRSVCQF
jgi:Cys-rich repeat protein